MSRKLFRAGCFVLIALGLVHLLGHYSLVTAQGDTEAERQLLSLMRGNRQDMGLGFVRSMFDILAGFSLTFSVLSAGMGLVGLVLLGHDGRAPGMLRQVSIAYAGTYGVMTGIGLRYWFPAPLFFLAAAFLCFAAAVATARREQA
jgi:hypothetical protein